MLGRGAVAYINLDSVIRGRNKYIRQYIIYYVTKNLWHAIAY